MTRAVVIGKFLPPHHGHRHLIRTAVAGADHVDVIVCDREGQGIDGATRAAWLAEIHPEVRVHVTPDDIPDDRGDETSRAWAARTVEVLGAAPDLVFTSEAYGDRYAAFLGARHVCVDPERVTVPVSATQVRADPARWWAYLEPCVRAHFAARVVVVGAESTGTTTLAAALAAHYGTVWVPEYGRAYCEELIAAGVTIEWASGDFEHIATRQLADEDEHARRSGPVLVCDTDALATSIWHERYLGVRSPAVEALATSRRYTAYLLTGDEIPFEQDGTRDGEHVRGWMHERFRAELARRPEPWLEVRGTPDERLAAATAFVDGVLGSTHRP